MSDVLMEAGIVDKPVQAVIRKGKQHYVCDDRLERRLKQVAFSKKNASARTALRSLGQNFDLDAAQHLSGYDRSRVCVPQTCRCQRPCCRYRSFLDECGSGRYAFQICNHNLLLADAMRREKRRRPLLADDSVLIIDEAHKLPETTRQMLGVTLTAENIMELCRTLDAEGYLIAADRITSASAPLVRKLLSPEIADFTAYERALIAPARTLDVAEKQIRSLVSPDVRRTFDEVHKAVKSLCEEAEGAVTDASENERNETVLCATVADLGKPLKSMLWNRQTSLLLTTGTLAIGDDFQRYRRETGLTDGFRVSESVSLSPFRYQEKCLLYFTPRRKRIRDGHSPQYYDRLAKEIGKLLKAAHGHALVLFTAYAAVTAVKSRLSSLPIPIYAMDRNAAYALKQFRTHPGSVLFATGAAWEGMDFAGDCVSLLVIPNLPFPQPNALSERKRGEYPDLHSFIRDIIVPEMQIKLKQGFGRAIRTETDSCVVAILNERAGIGGPYHEDVLAALPEMEQTERVREDEIKNAFLRMYHKLRSNNAQILLQLQADLRAVHNRRLLWSEKIVSLNQRISDITDENHLLAEMNCMGLVDPDIYIARSNRLAQDLKEAIQERDRLMNADDDRKVDLALCEKHGGLSQLYPRPQIAGDCRDLREGEYQHP